MRPAPRRGHGVSEAVAAPLARRAACAWRGEARGGAAAPWREGFRLCPGPAPCPGAPAAPAPPLRAAHGRPRAAPQARTHPLERLQRRLVIALRPRKAAVRGQRRHQRRQRLLPLPPRGEEGDPQRAKEEQHHAHQVDVPSGGRLRQRTRNRAATHKHAQAAVLARPVHLLARRARLARRRSRLLARLGVRHRDGTRFGG